MQIWRIFTYTVFFGLTTQTLAQTVTSMAPAFTGVNVYAPTVIYDDQQNVYKMWYGGWQAQSDYPNDKIYYRTSSDGTNWSSPVTVITPSMLGSDAEHVNDPTVTKHYNALAGAYQYTMFFVKCVKPCQVNSDNQIWSSVSGNGVSWGAFELVLGESGASTPSSIIEESSDGGFFSVYYSNTAENGNHPKSILRARVDGNRHALSTSTVFTYTHDSGDIANPEVRNVNGTWDLFFNVYHTVPGATHSTGDIYLTKSTNNLSWSTGSELALIANNPTGPICNTLTPGALTLSSGQFWLYFSSSPYSPGTPSCSPAENTSIQRWTYQQ